MTGTNVRWRSRVFASAEPRKTAKNAYRDKLFLRISLIGVSETRTTSLFIIIFILSSKNISFLKKNKEMPLFSSWHLRRHGRNRLLEELFRYNKNRNILEYKREDLQ
jgi:hypothetical protein